MRILIITQTLNPKRGYGRFAFDLIGALQKKGVLVTTLVGRGETIYLNEKPVLWLNKKIGFLLNPFIIRWHARGITVIHALDGYPDAVFAALSTFGMRKKLIITLQGNYAVEPLYHAFKSKIVEWAYLRAAHLVAISRYTRDEVLKKIQKHSIIDDSSKNLSVRMTNYQ